MQSYYLPAWGRAEAVTALGLLHIEGWFDAAPLGYAPALIAYPQWPTPFTFPRGTFIFGDSGGFTLRGARSRKHFPPGAVVRWQAAQCTVGCVLDLPPHGGVRRLWHEGMDKTVRNTREALPEYERLREAGTPFRWWGILHGNDEREMRDYHAALSAVYPFTDEGEGWAIRVGPTPTAETTARALRLYKDLGITRAHFLMATAFDVIATLYAFGARAGLTLLTFDSTTPMTYARNRCICHPHRDGLALKPHHETEDDTAAREWLLEDCPCPVCEYCRDQARTTPEGQEAVETMEYGPWWQAWTTLHNIQMYLAVVERHKRLAATDPDGLLRAVFKPSEAETRLRRLHYIFGE